MHKHVLIFRNNVHKCQTWNLDSIEYAAGQRMTTDQTYVPILEGREEADTVRRREKHFKPLSLLPLVALIFYDVSGGPFGIEVI